MAKSAIFIGWGGPVRGREQKAVEVLQKSIEYWTSLQASGAIESFEVALLEPHGGDLGGFALLRGERESLAQVRVSEEFQEHTNRANLVVDGLGVVGAVLGEGLDEAMARYGRLIGELA